MALLLQIHIQVKRPHFPSSFLPFSHVSNPFFTPTLDHPHRISEWASALNEWRYFYPSVSFSGMFSFSDVPKCSAIASRLWNNNIQFHSMISLPFWQVQSWKHNIGRFTPGDDSGMCFLNGRSLNKSKVMTGGCISLWDQHYHFFWFWGIQMKCWIWLRMESNFFQEICGSRDSC